MSAHYRFVTTGAHPENRDQLMQRVLDYARRNDKFPSANDTAEKYNIRAYWRSQEEWCLEREKLSLSRFILRWTREKAAEYRKDHDGQQPSSGPIKGFEDYSWDLLRTCFAKQQLSPKLEDIVACDPDGYRLDGSSPVVAVKSGAPRDRRQRGWQRPGL